MFNFQRKINKNKFNIATVCEVINYIDNQCNNYSSMYLKNKLKLHLSEHITKQTLFLIISLN